ncbi:MAG: hypothetical protein FJX35_15465 [Alphaproteobacteria bacterium]|nr:hypothetical protein [Alphaproteobacteria bacterium]
MKTRFSLESDLYPPIKAFLETQGYQVKGEIHGCDLVATRGKEPPVIVELKLAFSMGLLLQGIDRLALTDHVYLAVPAPGGTRVQGMSVHRSDIRKLCRRLGLGLMTVMPTRRGGHVEVLLDPVPYQPRKATKRLTRLLGEHTRRAGDPNRGGVTRTPLMTAYRQEALRCALLIRQTGTATTKVLRESGVVPNATKILQADYYGWFERVARGCYRITEKAGTDIQRYEAAGTLPVIFPPLPKAGQG